MALSRCATRWLSWFLLSAFLASMLFVEGKYFEPQKNILYSQRYKTSVDAIWAPADAPSFMFVADNGGTSSITLDLVFTPYYNVTQTDIPGGLIEVIVLHEDDYESLGLAFENSRLICCDGILSSEGYCVDEGAAIFQEIPRIQDSFLRHAFPFVLDKSLQIRVQAELTPTVSGVHWLFLVNCLDFSADSVYFSGTFALRNSYGYLPADHWGYVPLFLALACTFILFLICWTVLLVRMHSYLHVLHYAPLVIAFLGLTESILFLWNLKLFNDTADGSPALILAASIVGALKRSSSLALLVLLGMGFPIARSPSLQFIAVSCICCASLYAGFSGFAETVNNWSEFLSSYSISAAYVFATIVPMAMISALLFGWVIVAHLNTLRLLPRNNAANTPDKFRLQFKIIALLGFTMTVFSLVETISFYRTAVYVVYWPYWWVWQGAWQIFFIVPFLLLTWIWRPSEKTPDMIYTAPDRSSDSSSSSDDEPSTESPPILST